uniref:Calreticulin n=1 Tax=Oncorhynchus kisutch TaxID=8019 RepID=A0A8C7MNM8_ONCKI
MHALPLLFSQINYTGTWPLPSDYGTFVLTAGKFYGDVDKDKGLQTSQDARFYSASSRFESVSNKDQPLVIQFTVKHEQNIDCGGGYLKCFPADLNQENIIFVFACSDLLFNLDNTYEVEIDNKKDWDVAETIPDPDAKKPDDWNDEMDGEWEPPMVTDPDYKGEWKPKQIDNPAYKGKWVNPEIDNPDYTVKSGTIFDNFLNDPKLAEEVGNETWGATKVSRWSPFFDPEKMMDSQEEERKKQDAEEINKKDEETDSKHKDEL